MLSVVRHADSSAKFACASQCLVVVKRTAVEPFNKIKILPVEWTKINVERILI
jgi:hypothetical protein